MGRRLAGTVPIHSKDGTTTWYGPDDIVPDEVAALIGDHAWIDDDEPAQVDGDSDGDSDGADGDGPPPDPGKSDGSGDGPPPMGGPGSGTDAWAAYASAHGVQFDEDATRVDIIAACTAAGVPTE